MSTRDDHPAESPYGQGLSVAHCLNEIRRTDIQRPRAHGVRFLIAHEPQDDAVPDICFVLKVLLDYCHNVLIPDINDFDNTVGLPPTRGRAPNVLWELREIFAGKRWRGEEPESGDEKGDRSHR